MDILKKINVYLNRPYALTPKIHKDLGKSFLYGAFVTLFLLSFQPYGLNIAPFDYLIFLSLKYGFITTLVMVLICIVKHSLIKRRKKWVVKNELATSMITLFFVGMANTCLAVNDVFNTSFTDLLISMLFSTFKIGLIPIGLELLIANNFALRRGNLKKALKVEQKEFIIFKDVLIGQIKLFTEDIILIKSDDHYQKIYTIRKCYHVRQTLSSLENLLKEDFFMRVHRSSLINIKYLKQIKQVGNRSIFVLLTNGEEIKVSRRNQSKIQKYFKNS